jgi:hypothetical protein
VGDGRAVGGLVFAGAGTGCALATGCALVDGALDDETLAAGSVVAGSTPVRLAAAVGVASDDSAGGTEPAPAGALQAAIRRPMMNTRPIRAAVRTGTSMAR